MRLLKICLLAALLVVTSVKVTLAQELSGDAIRQLENNVVRVIALNEGQTLSRRVASGFVWDNGNWVVTAYHVVAGADHILIETRGEQSQSRRARIEGVLRDQDLALLLLLDGPLNYSPPLHLGPAHDELSQREVWVVGFPEGTLVPRSRMLRISEIAHDRLDDGLDSESSTELRSLGFPSLDLEIIALEGDLLPGDSGAPIVDRDGQVIGVGSGGLELGRLGLGWAIPATHVAELKNASLDSEAVDEDALRTVRTVFFESPGDSPNEPGYSADNPITRNSQWTPVVREFGGVEMVLVPTGCFKMGSTDDQIRTAVAMCNEVREGGDCQFSWFEDETPQHEICFDQPFWIDKYEVTNEQYGSSAGPPWCSERSIAASFLPQQPRNCVGWQSAANHCWNRGEGPRHARTVVRLPTEAEWEYAARGPDNLVYPWGNNWNPQLANWEGVSNNHTMPVGSFPGGASWVGALDMSGNLQEWVNSLYDPYPYDSDHEREDADLNYERVLRGGSYSNRVDSQRTSSRGYSPGRHGGTKGFRCARSYEP